MVGERDLGERESERERIVGGGGREIESWGIEREREVRENEGGGG